MESRPGQWSIHTQVAWLKTERDWSLGVSKMEKTISGNLPQTDLTTTQPKYILHTYLDRENTIVNRSDKLRTIQEDASSRTFPLSSAGKVSVYIIEYMWKYSEKPWDFVRLLDAQRSNQSLSPHLLPNLLSRNAQHLQQTKRIWLWLLVIIQHHHPKQSSFLKNAKGKVSTAEEHLHRSVHTILHLVSHQQFLQTTTAKAAAPGLLKREDCRPFELARNHLGSLYAVKDRIAQQYWSRSKDILDWKDLIRVEQDSIQDRWDHSFWSLCACLLQSASKHREEGVWHLWDLASDFAVYRHLQWAAQQLQLYHSSLYRILRGRYNADQRK